MERECYACGTNTSFKKGYIVGKNYNAWIHNYDNDDNMLCLRCANSIIYHPPTIRRVGGRSKQVGEEHWHWRGGIEYKGAYRLIYAPNHPRAHHNKMYEHVLVMEKHLGRYLNDKERIHHKDHNKKNNNIENLILTSCQSDHAKLHTKSGRQECKYCKGMRTMKDGIYKDKQIWYCSDCNKQFRVFRRG